MGQITLRGLEPDIEKKIREQAKLQGKSINKYILDVIGTHDQFQKSGKRSKACSLKKLAGGWKQNEADQFFESIQGLEQIDERLWR